MLFNERVIWALGGNKGEEGEKPIQDYETFTIAVLLEIWHEAVHKGNESRIVYKHLVFDL